MIVSRSWMFTSAFVQITSWPIFVAIIAVITAASLARIVSIERSHYRVRQILEKRVSQRTHELERAYALSEHVVNSATESIVVVDSDGRTSLVNPPARRLLGLEELASEEEVSRQFSAEYPGARNFVEQHRAEIEGQHRFTVTGELVGRIRTLEVSGAQINGTGDAYVFVIRDITDAITLLEMKTRFVSIVSHEIRTPLTSLAGSLKLLDAGVLGAVPPRAADLISVALQSTSRLIRLVNDLLDLDRLESDRVTLDRTCMSTDDLLVETIRTLQPFAADHGVSLITEGGPFDVWVDHDRIAQVFLNIVQNAVKFSPRDTTVKLSVSRDTDGVVFIVDDQGRGIPPHMLEEIFEPFTQAESTDDRRNSGTGLGLSIARRIVQRHGGRLWAENHEPEGARFIFTIPDQEVSS